MKENVVHHRVISRRTKPLVVCALAILAGGVATASLAQSTATVNVTGNIQGTCNVTGGSTTTINLGNVSVSAFSGAGTTSPISAPQNIVLTCTSSPGITMTMTGTQAPSGPNTTLALTGTTGIATGVGVQILNNGTGTPTTPLVLGASNTIPTGATVTIPVAARYYAINATPGAGTANSTATLTFRFN
ncbi:MAG TPA: fimbrial protein [Dyella sp.]|uniref:fimbrial protein n=1 Tax=Dyella sp. TaxID=1869338 RepID=UPI002BB610A5|nr:fimbrial protein [Dyella sp.]HTV87246.1 fimbrial protein [Dyella sp.]